MKLTQLLNKLLFSIFAVVGISVAIWTFILRTDKSSWKDFNPKWSDYPFVYAAWIHFPSGSIMLITGIIQFIDILRQKYRLVHVWSGRLYLLSGTLQSLSAWILIPINKGGPITTFIFSILNILYMITLFLAAYYIVSSANRNIKAHQKYMTRNIAYGFFPVTFRIFHFLGDLIFPDKYSYIYAVIMAVVNNVVTAEILLYVKEDKQQQLLQQKQKEICKKIVQQINQVNVNKDKKETAKEKAKIHGCEHMMESIEEQPANYEVTTNATPISCIGKRKIRPSSFNNLCQAQQMQIQITEQIEQEEVQQIQKHHDEEMIQKYKKYYCVFEENDNNNCNENHHLGHEKNDSSPSQSTQDKSQDLEMGPKRNSLNTGIFCTEQSYDMGMKTHHKLLNILNNSDQ